jgi:D-arabinose 1-dehydrogenase-like Zn-dependent alcohol dehydrogenase
MKTKAMVLETFNQPLQQREFTIQPLKAGQILVKMLIAGVCGSDVHISQGEDPRIVLPLIPGHEGVGTIVESSGDVVSVDGEQLRAGDRILWNRGVTCGHCYYCLILKEPSLCSGRKVYGISCGQPTDNPNGCYSEYIVLLKDTALFKVPTEIDPAALVSASCSGATIAHAFDMTKVRTGDTVVVQGPGPLGIYAAAFARNRGATQVIVIGGTAERLELCKQFGATTVLNRKQTTAQERRETIYGLTHGRGADIVVEAAGFADAFTEGLSLLRNGGSYLSTGYAQPVGRVELDPYLELVRKNIRIQGVWVSDVSHTRQALELVLSAPELFSQMITHRFPLEQANVALESMASRNALKAVIIP